MSQEIHDAPRAPRSLHRVVWALTLVELALPVTALVVFRQVLTGALDAQYFSSSTSDENGNVTVIPTPGITFWDRWTLVSYVVPTDRVLLAATAVCVAVAGLHLAAGERWPLHRACRWVAAAGGALSSLVALAVLVVMIAASQRTPDDAAYFSTSTSLLEVVLPVSALVTVAVFGVVAVIVLVGDSLPAATVGPAAAVDVDDAEAEADEPGELAAADEPAGIAVVDEPEPRPVEVPVAFPRPSADEYARYRRPGA
ncbi:hypothetical protein ACFQ46_03015 [Kineococcus sp. GCM10028916]|uniref:hypothetical protein n=1 Tax=Kineococcus sp. GCM10028916 TaxID=3273394 RepID=UPI00362FA326